MKDDKPDNPEAQPSHDVAAGNVVENQNAAAAPVSTLFNPIKVSNQAQLDAAVTAKEQFIEIEGTWEDVLIRGEAKLRRVYISGTAKVGRVYISGTVEGSVYISGTAKVGRVYISGTVEGSVYISGTVEGSVYISGTVEGSVYISGTAKVGSVYIYGTVEGSVYISGTAKVGSVYISGTVEGSVYISGTVEGSVYISGTAKVGSVYISGTVEGSVYISGTAKVGSVYISGTAKVGSVDIYGTVEGSVYISGTAKEEERIARKFYGAALDDVRADFDRVLDLANEQEITTLRQKLVAGEINGRLYEGPCCCLVGTLAAACGRDVFPRDETRLAEKWFMPIAKGHTPDKSTHARVAVEWIDLFLDAKKQPANG